MVFAYTHILLAIRPWFLPAFGARPLWIPFRFADDGFTCASARLATRSCQERPSDMLGILVAYYIIISHCCYYFFLWLLYYHHTRPSFSLVSLLLFIYCLRALLFSPPHANRLLLCPIRVVTKFVSPFRHSNRRRRIIINIATTIYQWCTRGEKRGFRWHFTWNPRQIQRRCSRRPTNDNGPI